MPALMANRTAKRLHSGGPSLLEFLEMMVEIAVISVQALDTAHPSRGELAVCSHVTNFLLLQVIALALCSAHFCILEGTPLMLFVYSFLFGQSALF